VVAVAAAWVAAVLDQLWGNGEERDGSRLPKQQRGEGWRGYERRRIAKVWESVGVSVCRLEPVGTLEGNASNCRVGIVLLI